MIQVRFAKRSSLKSGTISMVIFPSSSPLQTLLDGSSSSPSRDWCVSTLVLRCDLTGCSRLAEAAGGEGESTEGAILREEEDAEEEEAGGKAKERTGREQAGLFGVRGVQVAEWSTVMAAG